METNKIKPYSGTQEKLMQSDSDVIMDTPAFHQYSSVNPPVLIAADFGDGDDSMVVCEYRIDEDKIPVMVKVYNKDDMGSSIGYHNIATRRAKK